MRAQCPLSTHDVALPSLQALCSPPFFQCLTVCQLDGDAADVTDPRKIWVPHTGILEVGTGQIVRCLGPRSTFKQQV